MKQVKYNNTAHKDFMPRLRKEVHQVLKAKGRKMQQLTYLKALCLVSLFVALLFVYWTSIATSPWSFAAVLTMGTLCLPLVLNIGHEAVHGTFSKNDKLNKLGNFVFYFLGTSSYFWELRHLSSHHLFSNVSKLDMDIEQSAIIRLSEHQEYEDRHAYQHWYMPLAFCFYTLIWFFVRDFRDIKIKIFGNKEVESHPNIELVKLFLAKIVHVLFFFGIPYMMGATWLAILGGFLLFHLTASVITTFALVSTHVGEDQEIIAPNANGELPYSWAEHQLRTTADFATNNKMLTHYFGGFNHHVAHHLFPYISHIYYPYITPLIKKHAEASGLPYMCFPNLYRTSISHLKRLKSLSFDPEL